MVTPGPAPGSEGIPRLVPGPNGGQVSPAYGASGELSFHYDPPSISGEGVAEGAATVGGGIVILIGILLSPLVPQA
jgi:hypothetical protein